MDGAVLDVSSLDQIVERAFGEARFEAVAQAGHAEIGEIRADAQPVDLLLRLDQAIPRVRTIEIFWRAELRGNDGVLLGGERPDRGDVIAPSAALHQHVSRRGDRGLATPGNVGFIGDQRRLRFVIDPLHEKCIAFARGEYADRFRGHRPSREILHDRAKPIGAAENQVIALRLGKQRLDRGAMARHLGGRETRIFGVDDFLKVRRKRHQDFFGSATIMSSSTRAPGDDNWLMHTVVLAGFHSPKYLFMVACMPSASRMSVKYFVTLTTSRQSAPTLSRIDSIASIARVVCSAIPCGCTCSASTCGCLW